MSLTGNGIMTYRELDKIVVQIVYGFGVAFAIVLALEFLIFRSIRIALISIVPNLLPVCTCFVAMHLLKMDLRLDNAIVLCVAIGGLFNTTIHIVARIRQEIAAGATDTDAIVERALKAVGPASFYTAAVLSCGFAVLLLSNFPGFKQLGLFALVTMLTAFFSDVVFTTTFMALFYDWDGAFARARRFPRRPLGAPKATTTSSVSGRGDASHVNHSHAGARERWMSWRQMATAETIETSESHDQLPPGPSDGPFIQLKNWLFRLSEFLDDCHARYGDSFTIRLPRFPPMVFVSDPAAVKEVFTGDPDGTSAGQANLMLKPTLGQKSLLLLDGPHHRGRAQAPDAALPWRSAATCVPYAEIMREATRLTISGGKDAPGWPVGRYFPVHQQMKRITMIVMLRAVFGLEEGDEVRTPARPHRQAASHGQPPALLHDGRRQRGHSQAAPARAVYAFAVVYLSSIARRGGRDLQPRDRGATAKRRV